MEALKGPGRIIAALFEAMMKRSLPRPAPTTEKG